ncbi:MAG TPA: glycosyltransferase [Acidimicrobiales bacterium]|nr:glycosyltransferase [Acidimicrobiales bacterium]
MQPVGDGGGSEHALIGMLRQLAADGWSCHVAVPGPVRLAAEYAAAGATVHVLPMPRLTTSGGPLRWVRFAAAWPLVVARLVRLVRGVGAGVVHTNSLHSWYGWAAAWLTRRPHVWHAREIVFQSRAALGVERFLARRFATTVIAVSGAVAAQLDPANVVTIVDDADPDRFGPDRAGRFRTAAGLPDGVPLIGSVARIDTWKGFGVLLDAFPLVAARRPEVLLVIAGSPVPGKEAYADELRRRAGGLTGVHWMGHRGDVPELMADLDLFVLATTEPEPFGLVIVEALASGVPVVAGAAGGPLDILGPAARGESPAGRLVTPGDPGVLAGAICDLLPAGGSTAAGRRARPPLRAPQPGRFAPVFDQLVEPGRSAATSR